MLHLSGRRHQSAESHQRRRAGSKSPRLETLFCFASTSPRSLVSVFAARRGKTGPREPKRRLSPSTPKSPGNIRKKGFNCSLCIQQVDQTVTKRDKIMGDTRWCSVKLIRVDLAALKHPTYITQRVETLTCSNNIDNLDSRTRTRVSSTWRDTARTIKQTSARPLNDDKSDRTRADRSNRAKHRANAPKMKRHGPGTSTQQQKQGPNHPAARHITSARKCPPRRASGGRRRP